tara:strand:- start:163 stop:564 length:402 start_codon:yes stop_codon:yes gene_type:complete
MNNNQYLKEILSNVKTIAVVGASSKPDKDSYRVMEALINFGYEVFPVNPNYAGEKILGKECYPNLKAIKEKVDMVDIFRPADFIFNLTKEVMEIKAEVLWTQEGIIHEESASLGRNAGLVVVMDECPKKILED